MPTLALLLALATGVRADCANQLKADGLGGTAVLIGTEELSEEYLVPAWTWPPAPIIVKVKYTRQTGTYQMPDGSRIRVLCDEKLELS